MMSESTNKKIFGWRHLGAGFTPLESSVPRGGWDEYNPLPFPERAVGSKTPPLLTGFTFIDVLVGTALVLIVFFGIFGAYQLGLKTIGVSERKITATAIANQQLEKIRNLPYSSVGVKNSFPDGVLEASTSTLQNNIEYTIEQRVDFVIDAADGIALPEDECPNDYKKVEVEISFTGRFAGQVQLVTDIIPKNLVEECATTGGILLVSVFDAYGAMVSSPLMEVKDPETGQILKTAAPATGEHYFSLATSTYQVVVSKEGYSSDRTYGPDEVATPEKPHPIVLESQVTDISLSIDKASAFSVETLSPWGIDYFSDSFLDQTKISALENLTILGGQAELSAFEEAPWFNANWLYRKRIVINHNKVSGSQNLLDFSMLINRIDAEWRDVANGGRVAKTDGSDILFTAADGVSKINHEIERYDPLTGELISWVKVPALSFSADTPIYIYYGNSQAAPQWNNEETWDNNFVMVQHLDETAKTEGLYDDHFDSTFNNNDGETMQGVLMNVAGQINGADKFDGNDDYVDFANATSLDILGAITLEAWVKPAGFHSGWNYVLFQPNYKFEFGFYNADAKPRFKPKNNQGAYFEVAGNGLGLGQWHYLVGQRSGSLVEIYVDGVLEDSRNDFTGELNNGQNLMLGGKDSSTESFNGTIDEIKISNMVRGGDWIKTSYNNQQDPSSFYAVGREYLNPGWLVSAPIAPDPAKLLSWKELSFTDSEPFNTNLKYQVYYATNTSWLLIPNSDLAGNSQGFNLSPVNLSGLNKAIYSQLKIRADFSTNNPTATPVLYDWQVSWITSTATPIPNVIFNLKGEKLIGINEDEEPVYKYSQSHNSGSAAQITIANLEWDAYTFSVAPTTGLDLVDISPSPQPIGLFPDTNLAVDLYLDSEDSLLLTAQNQETLEPVFTASVRLYNTALNYDATQYTDIKGQTYFMPLVIATYNLDIAAPGYLNYTGTIAISGDMTKTIRLEQIE